MTDMPQVDRQVETLAITVTDVEGSTALRLERGDVVANQILRDHAHVLRQQVRKHGGVERQFLGDGFLLSFASPADAVACAATLFGGGFPDEAEAVLAALPTMRGEPGHVVERYLRWVEHMQPAASGPDGWIAPNALRPDRVGEDFVAMILTRQPGLAEPVWPVLSHSTARCRRSSSRCSRPIR